MQKTTINRNPQIYKKKIFPVDNNPSKTLTMPSDFAAEHAFFTEFFTAHLPTPTNENREQLLHTMEQYHAHVAARNPCCFPKPALSAKYLLTFTIDPKKGEPTNWIQYVRKQLDRRNIIEAQYAVEHEESNKHAHAYVVANRYYTPKDFKAYIDKVGHVDVRKVTNDNGVTEYIGKESQIYKKINIDDRTTQWHPVAAPAPKDVTVQSLPPNHGGDALQRQLRKL